jgi:hypothetical protein
LNPIFLRHRFLKDFQKYFMAAEKSEICQEWAQTLLLKAEELKMQGFNEYKVIKALNVK